MGVDTQARSIKTGEHLPVLLLVERRYASIRQTVGIGGKSMLTGCQRWGNITLGQPTTIMVEAVAASVLFFPTSKHRRRAGACV